MARIPDADQQRREFATFPFQQRRQVVSAVNRGRAVSDPKLAGHAVIVARRQARLWRWAWLIGPIVGAFRLLDSVQAALLSAAISTFALGLMSWWWYTRAVRAEQRNFALTTEGKRAARKAGKAAAPAAGKGGKGGASKTGASKTGAAGGAAESKTSGSRSRGRGHLPSAKRR